jgi:hypothetical protein
MKSYTEEEFSAELKRDGITLEEWTERTAAALGITGTASVEEANAIAAGPWPGRAIGSVRSRCDDCENYVSLSPRSQQILLQQPRLVVLCIRCAQRASREKKADA